MNDVKIKIEHLYKRFGDLEVLKDISTEFEAGKVSVLLGPSGSGKSTLLRCINKLELIQSGKIFLDGIEISGEHSAISTQSLRQKVGMVFQSFNLFPHLTVMNNLLLGPQKVQKIRDVEGLKSKAMEILTRMGLEDRYNSYPDEL